MADPGGARLGPRARLRRVHAVPRRPRLHGALHRAHPPLAATAAWTGTHENGPEGQLVYGIVQGGVHEDLRVASARRRSPRARRRDRDRRLARRRQGRRCTRSSAGRPRSSTRGAPAPPARHRGDRRPRARRRAAASTRSTARCRPGSGATAIALVPDPAHRWRVDLARAALRERRRAAHGGLPVPDVRDRAWTRGYLRYLARTRELTGMRLLTLHNLAFVQRVMARAARRASIAGRLGGGGGRRCARAPRP